ncbi:hypothetical protein Patl1_37445 [Pistacia atlantica]|nr:hypothetical protein Patl1_37445 [Pistacia atlantica]
MGKANSPLLLQYSSFQVGPDGTTLARLAAAWQSVVDRVESESAR